MQARTTPRGARRAAPRTCGHPADASHVSPHHQPLRWQRRHLRLFCQRLCAKRPRRASPLGVLDLCPEVALVPALAARLSPLRCGQTVSAPAAAAPPHHAPAAAVERLGKARRRAPFVRPATVRGWVSQRIGPLVLGVAVVREQKSKSLCRDHWARAQAPSPRPSPPHSGTPPDRAAAARGHFCHTPSVRRLAGRFGAKRWSIGRTAGRPSLTQASGSHRGRLRRPGAALEGPQAQRRRIVRVAQSPTRPASLPPESGSRLAPVQALYAPPRAPTPLRARSGGTGVPS